MTCCGGRIGNAKGGRRSRARQYWTARRRRRPRPSGAVASTGGKKMSGRKRQVVVDTGGRLLVVEVHAADISDTEGGESVVRQLLARHAAGRKIGVGQGYEQGLVDWARETYGVEVEVVQRESGAQGFVVEPRRWVVERSLAWYGRNRRLARDYEALEASAEAFVYIASVRQLLNRVAPPPNRRKPYQDAA